MEQCTYTKEMAMQANHCFDREVYDFLSVWVHHRQDRDLLQFGQQLADYLKNNALRDFFLNIHAPLHQLLDNGAIASHLSRDASSVYFDPISGDPLLAPTEQRIYNLARRLSNERLHIPFRSIHERKQTESGDVADIMTYPLNSSEIKYNSGNHFSSRPANGNVFNENSRRCIAKAAGNLQVMYKRGYLEDRLLDIKALMVIHHEMGETQPHFFVICSRHSPNEGHFGVSLVIMDPCNPDFPRRVLVCDTLLKELPHHPRWWNHFITEYANIFGNAIAEIVEDLSHPLQKVNVKGDDPFRHDWDCPFYAASMADALCNLSRIAPEFLLDGSVTDIHNAMKLTMPDYYQPNLQIKTRDGIHQANLQKRWQSGREALRDLIVNCRPETSYEL